MADKTSIQPLQPSTPFYATTPITTSTLPDPIPSSSSTTLHPSLSATTSMPMNATTSTPQRPNMERKQFDIQSLMSPPEPTLHDTFGRAEVSDSKAMAYATARRLPMSPPVSPATKILSPDECPAETVRDPILYSESQGSTASQSPLFVDSEILDTQRVVKGHIAARDQSLFRQASPPRAAEYELALGFKFQVMKGFLADRRGWYNRERAQLLEDRARANGGRRYTNIAPASGVNATRPPRQPNNPHHTSTSKVTKPVHRAPRQAPAKAPVDPNKVKAIREDKDYNSVPDYCPPLSSLPPKHNSLKVDWKGAPVDLRSDPDYELLHPDEVLLASNLRLDCATYLTSKRRIFVRRLECLKIGKEFRKTDSQQACKIDVNKASKLWQAFEKVGWLHADWVKKYL